jgi:hypothetical protein
MVLWSSARPKFKRIILDLIWEGILLDLISRKLSKISDSSCSSSSSSFLLHGCMMIFTQSCRFVEGHDRHDAVQTRKRSPRARNNVHHRRTPAAAFAHPLARGGGGAAGGDDDVAAPTSTMICGGHQRSSTSNNKQHNNRTS